MALGIVEQRRHTLVHAAEREVRIIGGIFHVAARFVRQLQCSLCALRCLLGLNTEFHGLPLRRLLRRHGAVRGHKLHLTRHLIDASRNALCTTHSHKQQSAVTGIGTVRGPCTFGRQRVAQRIASGIVGNVLFNPCCQLHPTLLRHFGHFVPG